MNGEWTPKIDPEKQCVAIVHTHQGDKELIINKPPCHYIKINGILEKGGYGQYTYERQEEIDGVVHYR